MHYYKFNIADWGLSTAHLSLEEEAIYFRLINHYYDTESPIPEETQLVFRRLRMGSQSELASTILAEFFELTDKGWVHSRCENILKDYRKTAKKNKLNGAKGGRPSNNAASSISQDKPTGLPIESQNNPNQELITTNHKPLTKENRESRFTPPTQQEAGNYFLERGSTDAINESDKFLDFYTSKNWMVGKNKMKDWQAAIRNWMRKSNETNQRSNQPSVKQKIGDAIHGATANDW